MTALFVAASYGDEMTDAEQPQTLPPPGQPAQDSLMAQETENATSARPRRHLR
jgi:hypothetical protein